MARVGVVVGHGIKPDGTFDPGAGDGDTNEQEAGDVAADALVEELRRHDVVIPVNEAFSDDPNYVGSVKDLNQSRVHLAVSLHHDWYKAPEGFFCHWYPGSEEGKRAADLMYHEVVSNGHRGRDDWHRARNLYFVRETAMPAVLVELGRIGQYDEEELRSLGRHVAHGILRWFDIDIKPRYEKDVAIVWHGPKDQPLAHQLGDEFLFWVDHVPNPEKSIKYAVLVGSAHEFADKFPESTKVLGKTAVGTGLAVKDALKQGLEEAPDREAPWPEEVYVDR